MDNSKKTLKIILAASLALIAIFAVVYFYFIDSKKVNAPSQIEDDTHDNNGSVELQEDNFILNAKYVGDSTWEYSVNGTLPTPCHTYTISPQVRESYPEQVEIAIAVISDSEAICAQVIQEVEDSGTFSASKEADISLTVQTLSKDSVGD